MGPIFLTMNGEFPFEKSSYDDFVMIIINKNSSNIAHFDDLFSTGMRHLKKYIIIIIIQFRKNQGSVNFDRLHTF